jgi:uncharacterized repeat protein (TIGR01451 family)
MKMSFLLLLRLTLLLVFGCFQAHAQQSANTVAFKVTYNSTTAVYTAWIVPEYNVPNANNLGVTEKGGTAQFTLAVPKDFIITNVTDIKGSWEKSPSKLGPGQPNQNWTGSGLDVNTNYYIIGKSAEESDYGVFTSNTDIALFTFKGNGCFGLVRAIEPNEPFIAAADAIFSLNVANSFYSRSGQSTGGNQSPLEQFRVVSGSAADCTPLTTLVANPETVSTTVGTPINTPILTNDTRNGVPVVLSDVNLTIQTAPTKGTTVVNPDGTIRYTPNAGAMGTDIYTYKICDKVQTAVCSTAMVTINLSPAPVVLIANPESVSTTVGTSINTPILTNDTKNGVPVVLSDVNLTIQTAPTKGTAVVNPDGTIRYTPNAGAMGTDIYTYKICDKVQTVVCSTAMVTINLSPAPVVLVANPESVVTPSGVATTTNVLGNDTRNGSPVSINDITLTIAQNPANGTVSINTNGTIIYTPNGTFVGTDSYTYRVCDKVQPTVCATTTVAVTVSADNSSTDLTITKTVSNSSPSLNDIITFTITVINNGDVTATNINIRDEFPVGLKYVSGAQSQKIGVCYWDIPSLAPGESKIFTVSAQVIMKGVSSNTASIDLLDQIDIDLTDNTATTCISVPIILCQGEQLELMADNAGISVDWYKDGVFFKSGNKIVVTESGSYATKSPNNACPTNNCCPIIVITEICCNDQICIPVTIKKIR